MLYRTASLLDMALEALIPQKPTQGQRGEAIRK